MVVKLKAVGGAKVLKTDKFKCSVDKSMAYILSFLRKQLKLAPGDSLFVYVDKFSPSPDENVGLLYRAYGDSKYLVVHYCNTPAYG